jgi:pimeloyl-ACP methyl ester carboxylesterase
MVRSRIVLLAGILLSAPIGYGQAPAAAPPSSQGMLDVDGGHLYYEECGAGPNVVLLHDGLLHSAVWDAMWPMLCGKYHVVRYDRRGYGRSDPAKSRFAPEEDLARLMQRVKMAQATLVGSSSGSAVAIDFALAHPDQVEALFLVGPVVHGMRSSDYFLQRGNEVNAPLSKGDVKTTADNWSKDRFQVSGERPDARKKIFEILANNPQNLRVAGNLEIRPSPPTVTRLAELSAPTLLIAGDGDIADVHAFAGAIQAAAPVVRREVWKDDGHLIQLEKPAELATRLETFVALAERKTVAVADAKLRGRTGTYSFFNSPATVALRNHRLVLQLNGDAEIPLFPESDTHFFVRTTGTEVQFDLDASGKTTAMVIHSPGAEPVRCPRV